MQALLTPDSIPVSIRFDDGDGPALAVRTLDAELAMSALFSIRLLVTVLDGDIALRTLVGRRVSVMLPDGTVLNGLIHRASHSPTGEVASGVVLEIGPHLWVMTQGFDEYNWLDSDIVSIATDFLADASVESFSFEITARPEPRPYTAQFDESNHDAFFRLLAEDGVATFFDSTAAGSPFVMTNDTVASSLKRERHLPYVPPSRLATSAGGHVHAVDVTAQSVVDSVGLRDYWAEQPDFDPIGSAEVAPAKTWAYYDRTRVGTGSTEAILKRRSRDVLAALRVGQELVRLEANVPVLPGVALTVDGAPRQEVVAPLLVLTTRLRWSSQPGEAAVTRCAMTCMPASQRFVPARLPKPKVGGLHTGKVVGEGEIDVDPLGRVLCELNWEYRPWTRRVRVSQAWAGPGYGFVTLPRVGDEVLIAFMDGDPDEPMVVGRVHNGKNVSPLTLPAQNTVSTWRSRSSPGGDGYNEILMDDAAGAERLDIHAQRDFNQKVERDVDAWVGRNVTVKIDGDKQIKVKGTGDAQFGQPCRLTGPDCEIVTTDRISLKSSLVEIQAIARCDTSSSYVHRAEVATFAVKGPMTVDAGAIILSAGSSSIVISPAGIKILSGGPVDINGAPINLNC